MPKIDQLHQEHSMDIVRGHLKKIVETYDLEWRVIHELIQNAIDAIQVNLQVTSGQIELILDLDTDAVTVTDNGTGFTNDPKLLCPNGTGKEKRLSSRSPAKGYQGVGLKAVMYSTTLFEIESQTDRKHWTFLAENLADYIDSEDSSSPEYEMETIDRKGERTYTKIMAHFPTGTLRVFLSGLNRFLKEDLTKWKTLYRKERDDRNTDPTDKYLAHFFSWYLRTQSYIGCVNRLLGVPVKNASTEEFEEVKPVNIKLHLKSETQFSENEGCIGDWLKSLGQNDFITNIPNRAWNYDEIATENRDRSTKYRIAPKIISLKPTDQNWDQMQSTFRDCFLDLKLTPNIAESDFRKKYADFIKLLERPRSRVKAEDYKDVFEKITGIYLAIGRTSMFELLGIQNRGIRVIASNGTLTEHNLTAVSTSSAWYLETIHMIINVDATLNVGKRNLVNTRLVGRINEFFEACYPVLVNISKLFVRRDADPPGEDPLPDVIDSKKLRRQNIPFRRFPNDENTLIGLFSVILSEIDETLSVYAYFSKARYDGKFSWISDEPRSDNDLLKLEFKVLLDDLVSEFDHALDDKEFTDLSLIVVWDRRVSSIGWEVKPITQARQNNLEQLGVPTTTVEYVLEDLDGHYCPLVCVADLLQKFSLVNGETDDLDKFVEELR